MELLSRLDVFLPFLDHIHSFGYRSNDIGDDYHNFSSTMGKQSILTRSMIAMVKFLRYRKDTC
jgi:hypothetical protein